MNDSIVKSSGVVPNPVPDPSADLAPVVDRMHRPLHDLRVSVTDRCNFRCVYCMPKEVFNKSYKFLPRKELLSFEEIVRVVRAFQQLGVSKIRLTGGEPLLRNDLESLVEQIAGVDGINDVSMTTNASILTPERALSLRDAGLKRVNVSLDALDDETFMKVNDVDITVQTVLNGIEAASQAGFDAVKVNMVVKKGMNDHSILPMAKFFHGTGQILRFIEFMDVGNSNAWDMKHVVSSREIADTIDSELPLEAIDPNYKGEVAKRWRYKDGGGEIGIISSVSKPFCGDCSRARLSAVGSLYTCLFATQGHDIRDMLRNKVSDKKLLKYLHNLWAVREDRYSETRSHVVVLKPKVEMSYIGG